MSSPSSPLYAKSHTYGLITGRRLTTSRSERLLGSYTYGTHGHATTGTDSSELGEEEVWSTVGDVSGGGVDGDGNDNHMTNNSQEGWSPRADGERVSIMSRRRGERHVGGLSLAFEDSSSEKTAPSRIVHQFRGHDSVAAAAATTPRHVATSAPVNVPDWSKILRVDSVESLHILDEEHEAEMVPPHEYLAREYARSRKMGGASVFEGVGRTLKGRDMRRVRDAVWSQTGFDG